MRLQLVSDLHIEFHKDGGQVIAEEILSHQADVLVLAGDIGNLRDVQTLKKFLQTVTEKREQTIYVAGNHEFYGDTVRENCKKMQMLRRLVPRLKISATTLSEQDVFSIRGQRFICGTGWFKQSSNPEAKNHMRDFREIDGLEPWVYERNEKFRTQLSKVRPADIVVSHHLPVEASTPERFKGSSINDFFVGGFDEFMGIPKLWLHGHTHDRVDYKIGNTRVLCNPMGYPGEASGASFDAGLIINV